MPIVFYKKNKFFRLNPQKKGEPYPILPSFASFLARKSYFLYAPLAFSISCLISHSFWERST